MNGSIAPVLALSGYPLVAVIMTMMVIAIGGPLCMLARTALQSGKTGNEALVAVSFVALVVGVCCCGYIVLLVATN